MKAHYQNICVSGVTFSVKCKKGIELLTLLHSLSKKKREGQGKSRKQAFS